MHLSVELSYYPLKDDYKPVILNFINALKIESIEVISNRMSTQVFGNYDEVMLILTKLMKWAFEAYGTAIFVAKFINTDRRPKSS